MKVEWPRLGRGLWDAFRCMGRAPSVSGVGEITNQEILAYQQVEGVQFNSWELSIIRMFDSIAMEAHSKRAQSG